MNYIFTYNGPKPWLRVDENAPTTGGSGRTGKLYVAGIPTITTGRRQILACQAAGLDQVITSP